MFPLKPPLSEAAFFWLSEESLLLPVLKKLNSFRRIIFRICEMLLFDYFLWCWFGKTEEVAVAETVCVRELDDLERQFQNYKEMKRKKASASSKRLHTYNKNLYQNL